MHNPTTIKKFELSDFYLQLSLEDKQLLFQSTQHMTEANLSPAQFLWMGASNLLPHRHYALAEQMLIHALTTATEPDDLAYIHANLAQCFYDQLENHPEYIQLCKDHCQEVYQLGYFQKWTAELLASIT